jgi:hypothetical protein
MTYLQEELETALRKLEQTERKLQVIDRSEEKTEGNVNPRTRLKELNEEIESLELARDLSQWHEQAPDESLVQDARQCVALAQLLARHPKQELLHHIFEKEYQPLHRYVRAQLPVNVRKCLRRINYPSKEANDILLKETDDLSEDSTTVSAYVIWMTRVQIENEKIQAYVTGIPSVAGKLESVVELCRPIVERVTYHFLQQSEERISSTRIDRLPEWVLNYVRENALEGGPFDFISEISAVLGIEAIMFQFLNEMCLLASYVIVQRQFFRDEKIVGPKSVPTLLSGAIEQLLTFDAYVRDLVVLEVYPLSMSQLLVAEDEDLWSWFISSERQWAMSTLFDTPVSLDTSPRRISARAELFSALIHSIQSKAALFATPGRYIAEVGVPLCQCFLDAVHESSTELRALLGQRKLISTEDLEKNLESWMDLINGTHMAAIRLNEGSNRKVDHDLARVGRSMDRLRDALVDECATTLVETVVAERANLASYLMRCSYMLSVDEQAEECSDLSPDLQETLTIFSTVLRICTDVSMPEDQDELKSIILFAPMAVRSNITDRLADKFLEVALDAHGSTPDISLDGAKTFYVDVLGLFGGPPLPPLAMRLIDVAKFMSMEPKQFHEIKLALSGLVQPMPSSGPLHFESFSQDGTLLDEAVSMIRAKGYTWMHLEDVLSILNRRNGNITPY